MYKKVGIQVVKRMGYRGLLCWASLLPVFGEVDLLPGQFELAADRNGDNDDSGR